MTNPTAVPLANLLSCIDHLGRLSMRHAPTALRHDTMALRLRHAEADAAAHRWDAVRDWLSMCIADVRMFEDYKVFSAEVAIQQAMITVQCALGGVDECAVLDAVASAPNVVRMPGRLRVVVGMGS